MTNIARIVWHGSGLGEEFAVSTTFQLDGALDETDANNITAGLDTAFDSTQQTKMVTCIANVQKWDLVSLYYYATDPRSPATIVGHRLITDLAGTSSSSMPLQTACCVTVHTGFSGASNRGRMYMPASGTNTAACRFQGSFVDQMASLAGYLLEHGQGQIIAHSARTQADPIVFSPKNGTGRRVTTLSADNKPDTQRRRAMNESPTYSSVYTPTFL